MTAVKILRTIEILALPHLTFEFFEAFTNTLPQGSATFELVGHIQSEQGSTGPSPFQWTRRERSSPEIQAFFRPN